MASSSRVILIITELCLFVALGGLIVGAIGDKWYSTNILGFGDTYAGLWKRCTVYFGETECTTRSNVLEFNSNVATNDKGKVPNFSI